MAVEQVERDARRTIVAAGHVGMVAYGIVHLLIGWLAAQVALGGAAQSGQKADQRGAVETIAAQPLGVVLLILLVIGLVAFGAWQLYVAAQGYKWVGDTGKRTRKRLGSAARGATAVVVAAYAVRLLAGAGRKSTDQTQREWTARLLSLPAGRILLGLIGVALIVIGVSRIRKGLTKKFLENLDMSKLPDGTRRLTTRLGQAGYPAKGVAIGIVGVLLGLAALRRNPNEAGGLDKALRTLAAQPFGTVMLVVMALGFVAYGVYCFAAARSQRS
jgi:hypothetical protein